MRIVLQENILTVRNAIEHRQYKMRFSEVTEMAIKPYDAMTLIYTFFAASFIGWIWEVLLHLVTTGNIVNRGMLHGPWLPIYGTGAVVLLMFVRKYAKKPVHLLSGTILSCGLIEYITSFALEMIFHMRWWDYSHMLLNINGRICAAGLLLFGFGGCLIVYIAGPLFRVKIKKLESKKALWICTVLVAIFIFDLMISLTHIRTGAGITALIP